MSPRWNRSVLYLSVATWMFAGACATGTTEDEGEGGAGGSSGVAGSSGAAGTTGVAGAAGGSSGLAGTTGVAGSPGRGGSSGVAGTTGLAGGGEAGRGGSSGVAGTTGEAGRGGSTGVAGSGAAGRGGSGGSGGGAAGSPGRGGSTGGGGSVSVGPSGLPTPPGAGGVARPSGTAGTLTVLNWAGFKGAVTFSFDDSNSSQIQHYSELNGVGVPVTFFMWTGKSDASNSIWMTAKNNGHELANHTQSHQSAANGADIDAASQFIMTKFGLTAWTMAAPNGDGSYRTPAMSRFLINRGVSDAVIKPNDSTDPFVLPTYIPPQGASASAFKGEIDSARTAGGWRTMCVHGFTGGSDGAYQPVPIDSMVMGMQYAKSLGDMWVGTMADVGAYWRGQKAFSSATTMMSGSDKTWTWTLPAHFPTGKYLRVTVPGGTLTQKGQELPWNDHGYYEIALDALSVTVSP